LGQQKEGEGVKRFFTILAFLALLVTPADAQWGGGWNPQSGLPAITFSQLPASPVSGDAYILTDCTADNDCSAGGGVYEEMVVYDGAAWVIQGDGGGAGATAYDDIDDPDAHGSIAMGAYTGTYTSATDSWGGMIIDNTDAAVEAATTCLSLKFTDPNHTDGVWLDLFSGDTQSELKIGLVGATPTMTMSGELDIVSSSVNFNDAVGIGEGKLTDSTIVTADVKDGELLAADLDADEAPADDDILTFDTTGDNFSWQTAAELGLGGTAYDDIGDPDASGSIAMGAHTGTYTSATSGWGGLIILCPFFLQIRPGTSS
jgi:hypothetical protein